MELQIIQNKIIEIRGHKVMLDFHLAELYEVETRALKQAVKRNMERFPEDFMFILTKDEWKEVITNCDNLPSTIKFSPAVPFAFTNRGVAMLSSVLKSKKAIAVNISIMRAFALLRQYLSDYKNLKQSIEALEKEMNLKFKDIYEALNFLLSPKSERKPIGYKQNKK